jgi:twinkle protein
VSAWWAAERWKPVGIVSTFKEIGEILNSTQHETLGSYPFPTLQGMTYGIQSGEFILFTALTGIGKTEIIRAIEYDLIRHSDHNLGIIHIEEGERRSIEGLVGYHWNTPAHHPVASFSPLEIAAGYEELVKKEDRVYFYKHYGSDDPNIFTSTIRYLAAGCGCRVITLDHISKIVSGWETDDERKTIDMLCTQLDNICKETGVALIMVSHVNDQGLTRGSRNISQTAHTHVHMSRDIEETDPIIRNTTKLTVRKNRDGSLTGPAGQLYFDNKTFTLRESTPGDNPQEVPF